MCCDVSVLDCLNMIDSIERFLSDGTKIGLCGKLIKKNKLTQNEFTCFPHIPLMS